MRLRYTPSFFESLDWFIDYYARVFPEGRENGKRAYAQAIQALKSGQALPRAYDTSRDLYELPLTNTPFSFLLRIHKGKADLLHLRDRRGYVTDRWLQSQIH